MDWTTVIQKIEPDRSFKLYCLYDSCSFDSRELRKLSNTIKRSSWIRKGSQSSEIVILPSRAQYISRHQHEGLFFQQRYQASYNDLGETVSQRLLKASISLNPLKFGNLTEAFELESLLAKPLLQLSSGEWQRFVVCEALITNPALIIMPELLKGLDLQWQQKILTILTEKMQKGTFALFTSDVPIPHPGVCNIPVNFQPALSHTSIPTLVSEKLVTCFRDYQSGFLPDTSGEIILQMSGVNIRYGDRKILEDIHWTVRTGDKWNIQGPNGAGKSTIISLVNSDNPQGYSQPIEMFGSKYGRHSIWDRKARISYFGSDFFQYFRSSKSIEQTLIHQLQTPYLNTLQPPDDLIQNLLAYFGLDSHRYLPYSGAGQEIKRQILLLAAYLKSSDILVLDEPYQDLGLETIRHHNQFLEAIQPFSDQTVIFVTHREDHKPGFLSQLLALEDGRIARN